MLPRPAWLAVGVLVAAGTASYLPLGGDSPASVAAAVAITGVLGAAATGAHAIRRPRLASALNVVALGAALVAARLAVGLTMGGDPGSAASPGASPLALPSGIGPWHARVESAHISKGRQIATLTLAEADARCSALMPADPRLLAGDRITWSGRIEALGDGDYERFLAAQGLDASCDATSFTVQAHDESAAGWLERFRQSSGDAVQLVVPEPGGGLAAAILIGLRDRVDRDVAAAFTTAGVSHIVAISGWNIAILSATIAAMLRGFLSRRRRAAVTVGAILAYTLFAGASASVVRAAVMAVVAVGAVETGRGSRVSVGLAWTIAGMLLVEPTTVADVGFQLSAAATAGLIAWATPITRWLEARAPRVPGPVRESLGVSLAAQVATLPVVLLVFGRLALISPAANLVAVPLVPPVMALGLVALAAGWLQMLGAPALLCGLVSLPASLLLSALMGVVAVAAGVPGASQTLPEPWNVAGAGVAAAALVGVRRWSGRGGERVVGRETLAAVRPRTRARGGGPRYGLLAGVVGLSVVVAASVVSAAPDGRVHVVVLDVGQGDAILIEGNRGSRILVDGGPDGQALLASLDRCVPSWDRRLDAVVLTHPHDDHVAGLVSLMERYRVDAAYESGWPSKSPEYLAWEEALDSHGLRTARLRTGSVLQLDDVTLRVVWPDDGTIRPSFLDPTAADNRKANDSSIVILGDYEGRRFLLPGDAEEDVDSTLVTRGLPRVDMLKVAHHGSATASSSELLGAIRPAVSVVSVGAANTYGHPNAGTMARLGSNSAKTFRTDQVGTVDVALDRAGVSVSWQRGASGGKSGPSGGGEHGAGAGGESGPPGAHSPVGRDALPLSPDPALLYDARDVRSKPARERGAAPLTRSTLLAPASFACRCRDSGMVGLARPGGRASGRSPPRGVGGTPA
jgi:competence protein ComEC